ncbi:regulator [Vibrio agarivorans]|nr:regulator [Vibrio agarivorans]
MASKPKRYHAMSNNLFFRELVCGLSIEETAELCFKSVKTVKLWDKGKPIPPECKRLMRMKRSKELGISNEWQQFTMRNDRLELPTGQLVTPHQILLGVALLELGAENDRRVSHKVIKYARALKEMI